MNPEAIVLLVVALPALLLLSGYGVARHLPGTTSAERLAAAILLGLAGLLWNLSVIGFFFPVSRFASAACLWPLALTVFVPSASASLWQDLAAVLGRRTGLVAALLALAMTAGLLAPVFAQPDLVFFDGTSSHDGFFWITGARRLAAHSYMDLVPADPDHPWANLTRAIAGWQPEWGRAGAEGYIAWVAGLSGLDPIRIYLVASAVLFPAWIAAVYLVVRTFLLPSLSFAALAGLVLLQPIFVFFHANANLPNLLGALTGALVVVATERTLRTPTSSWTWPAALALALHGLVFSYPEMVPFIALPCTLLAGRAVFTGGNRDGLRPLRRPLFALLAALALNPATLVRGVYGFLHSFRSARLDYEWANIFDRLGVTQYVPTLATLSVHALRFFGPLFGAVATVLLLLAAWQALARARDRFGALACLSGGAALVLYTLATHFSYGWQKSAQFAGVFIAALLPVASLGAPFRLDFRERRWPRLVLGAGVVAVFAISLVFHGFELAKWSRRKAITQDWFLLKTYLAATPAATTIVVDAATFPMAFFHGMWATYFLTDTRVLFPLRGEQNGGYVRTTVTTEHTPARTLPVLVGRAWADTFDANSPRLFSTPDFVLLRHANRVTRLDGVTPRQGLPAATGPSLHLDLIPHSASTLHLVLSPAENAGDVSGWRLSQRVAHGEPVVTELRGPPPWRIDVPLTAGEINQLELVANAGSPARPPVFTISGLRLTARP